MNSTLYAVVLAGGVGSRFWPLSTPEQPKQLLPLDGNPVEREWFVLHLASRQLPQVAVAFEQFLTAQGQRLIHAQLQTSIESKPRVAGRRPRPDRAALITD